jgi:hypothetical protein
MAGDELTLFAGRVIEMIKGGLDAAYLPHHDPMVLDVAEGEGCGLALAELRRTERCHLIEVATAGLQHEIRAVVSAGRQKCGAKSHNAEVPKQSIGFHQGLYVTMGCCAAAP